jgi:hypothetical protein
MSRCNEKTILSVKYYKNQDVNNNNKTNGNRYNSQPFQFQDVSNIAFEISNVKTHESEKLVKSGKQL